MQDLMFMHQSDCIKQIPNDERSGFFRESSTISNNIV